MSGSEDDDYNPVDVVVSSVGVQKGEEMSFQRLKRECGIVGHAEGKVEREIDVQVLQGGVKMEKKEKGDDESNTVVHRRLRSGVLSEDAVPTFGLASTAGSDSGHRIRLRGIKGAVRAMCLSPHGTILCAGGDSGELAMWDFDRPPERWRVSPTRVLTPFVNRVTGLQAIVAVHASLDGSYFVVCQDGDRPALVSSGGAQLGFCAMGERGLLNALQCKGHRAPVTDSSPHGTSAEKFLTASQDGTARVWDNQRFTAHSLYAVQHGSGQLDEHVVVESVCGLSDTLCGGGESFVTGGQDGLVQLWDTRLKYRPGGAVRTWDIYTPDVSSTSVRSSGPSTAGSSRKDHKSVNAHLSKSIEAATTMTMMSEEKHVGGMAGGLTFASTSGDDEENGESSASKNSSTPVVMVRVGERVYAIDLRQSASSTSLSISSVARSTLPQKGCTNPVQSKTVLSWMPSLPFVTDTTKVATCSTSPYSFFTGTSRKGFENMVGGHVVKWVVPSLRSFDVASHFPQKEEERFMASWCAGRPDEDVLCVAEDPGMCRGGAKGGNSLSGIMGGGGALFAGLSSGDVVVRLPPSSLRSECAFGRWWDSRPSAASPHDTKDSARQVGQKSWRDDEIVGLF